MRGGNGNFGIVTALEFEVQPVQELYAGAMFFALDRTADVLHAWTELLPSLPEEMTSWANVIHFPPDPALPDPLRGNSYAVVMAAFLGERSEGAELLRPLQELGPAMDTFAMQAPVGLAELAMDPVDPLPYRTTHALLDGLSPDAIAESARICGPGTGVVLLQLRHMGGALARTTPGAGARATLPGEISLLGVGFVPGADAEPVVRGQLDALAAAVASNRVGDYPNFVEEPADARGFFDAETWQRLRSVKAAVDPQDLFKGNHHIPPAERLAAAA
jgi:hypothetical protein